MKKTINPVPFILASASPRRRELLQTAGLSFLVVPGTVEENGAEGPPEEVAKALALKKALKVARTHPGSYVLGADTLVYGNGTVFGKPGSFDEARDILRVLSANTHKVVTGFSLVCLDKQKEITRCVVTEVTFRELSEKEINWYVKTGEPMDKAGAYGIQGVGAGLVKAVNGSYTNVVGLPVDKVLSLFAQEKIISYD